jgi:hypothetical protein
LITTLLCAALALPAASAEPSDQEEEGLVGAVRSVETRESLLVQTDRYDPQGRLIERIQGGVGQSHGLWPLRFLYGYDQIGRRISEAVRDGQGELVKETRYGYDDRGDRSAEVAVWGDGTFENASLYDYDEAHRRTKGLHYNAIRVINRNLFAYDDKGREIRERFERNYRYDAAGNQVVTSDRFDVGYEVATTYDDQGKVREKVVSDLKGRRQGRSEFRYDERGNQVEERIFDADGRITDRKVYRYEYDATGNWIKETAEWYEAVGTDEILKQSHVRERSITYH